MLRMSIAMFITRDGGAGEKFLPMQIEKYPSLYVPYSLPLRKSRQGKADAGVGKVESESSGRLPDFCIHFMRGFGVFPTEKRRGVCHAQRC